MNLNRKKEGSPILLLPHPRKNTLSLINYDVSHLTNYNSDQLKGLNLLHIFQQSQRLNDLNSSQIAENLFLPFWNFLRFILKLSIKCSDSPFLNWFYLDKMKLFLIGLLGATLGAKFDDQESDWTVSPCPKNWPKPYVLGGYRRWQAWMLYAKFQSWWVIWNRISGRWWWRIRYYFWSFWSNWKKNRFWCSTRRRSPQYWHEQGWRLPNLSR